jgi:hypothetical protein
MPLAAVLSPPSLWLLTALAGCGGSSPPADLSGCRDDQCRVDWLVAHWRSDPQRVVAEVQALPDGPERLAAVQAVAEAHPGSAGELCPTLPEGSARDRCKRINSRPHLWQIDLADPEAGAQGAGKVFPHLVPTGALVSPWEGVPGAAPTCPDDMPARLCRAEASWAAALAGRADDAARICLSIEEERWRFECFFEAAERIFEPPKRDRIGDAVSLCLGAGPYLGRCLGHLSTTVARSAPAAGAGERSAWERLNRHAKEARSVLDPLDPGLAARFTADAWARSLAVAYSTVPVVTGDPLDVVEPHAVPHVRAAAAWRLVQLEGSTDRSLAAWQALLEDALRARGSSEDWPPIAPPETLRFIDLWPEELPGEEQIQWAPLLVGLKRALVRDPVADGAVCLLEAAAQDSRKHPTLFASALDSPQREVRWTAARLLRGQRPDRALKARVEADADPLVRARAPAWP